MQLEENKNLKEYNTFGLEVKANKFIQINSLNDLEGIDFTQKHMILGGGSNVLFAKDFEGLILHVNIKGKEVVREDALNIWLKVGAGESWHETVLHAVENNWGGLENLSLIPGTVGAAPIQNIGAYGVELRDVLEGVEGIFLENFQTFFATPAECRFGYRNSIFKNELKGKVLITQVHLKLNKQHILNTSYGAIAQILSDRNIEKPKIKDISEAVIHIRQSKLPDTKELGNAGSFFKNPTIPNSQFQELKTDYPECPGYPQPEEHTKVPAGWLIEQCGWKGKRVGETGAHAKQALVLVNYGNAQGQEILNLSKQIQDSVFEKFGIKLEAEVTVV